MILAQLAAKNFQVTKNFGSDRGDIVLFIQFKIKN